jgi:tRNA 2-thiouridine synthesizing protein A
MADPVVLDTKGLKCPLPVLKARKALRDVPPGGLLRVLATDPGAVKDFEHFCRTTGSELVEQGEEEEGVLVFLIRKSG